MNIDDRIAARLELVDEHIRFENQHNLKERRANAPAHDGANRRAEDLEAGLIVLRHESLLGVIPER